jgi:hypothetical protein
VTITSPTDGSAISGATTVSGMSTDNVGVVRVETQVDGGEFTAATGTNPWTVALDTRKYSDGAHTIVARATDSSGNTSVTSMSVSVANAPAANDVDVILRDPASSSPLALIGRGRAAVCGSLSALLFVRTDGSGQRGAFFRDISTGATSYVPLPMDSVNGWTMTAYTLSGSSDLWVFGGSGPMYLRHYALSGSGLPTAATLISTEVLGDADSRQGDLVRLNSGALVLAWHQQGSAGPQGQWFSYRNPQTGVNQLIGPLQFMPTRASKQVAVQHPVDNTLWVFADADAWGQIGAAHFTETAAGLVTDWTDAGFITTSKYGEMGPDPENADLAAAADPSMGTIALAYQGAHRRIFSTSPVVTGAYPVVARLATSGSMSFLQLPIYVERVSSIGLVVGPGETTLMYRPIDETALTFNKVLTSVHRNGSWESATSHGTLYTNYERFNFGAGGAGMATRLSDGWSHLFSAG